MNFKHLTLLGVIALVVFGCVLAAGCTSTETPAGTALSSVAGEWYCPEFIDDDGYLVNGIQTIKTDSTGYWMQLAEDNPGIQLVRVYSSELTAPDKNGAFEKSSSKGSAYQMVYYPANDTLIQDGKNVYSRLDPFVGIWYGLTSSGDGKMTTSLFKPDGSGMQTISDADNGTAEVLTLTWKKNADGTCTVLYSDGKERSYTVDESGLKAVSSGGSVKTKAFTDTSYLVSVTGAWYNKDNDRSAVFNADGTGFLVSRNGIAPFTWCLKEIGAFEVTYTGGTWDDGTIAKGKVTKWTYDRESDVFTSTSDGSKYLRPAESIEGKITLI